MKTEFAVSEVKLTYKPKVKASERPTIRSSSAMYKLLVEKVYDADTIEHREFVKLILFNRAGKLIGVHHLSEGGINGTTMDVRVVMQSAILSNCSGIMISHNHPSGNMKPSPQDNQMTDNVKKACKIMEINFLDHIIVTTEGYYSYADEGGL